MREKIIPAELSAQQFDDLIGSDNVLLVDIRNPDELPRVDPLNALQIPMDTLAQQAEVLFESEKHIVLFCHSGIRTQVAMELLREEYHLEHVSHLRGGIIRWIDYKANGVR
jgi:adenylyltransferase/sulfurtransferase